MSTISRRDFLQRTALTTASASVFASNSFAAESEEPIRIGLIGCGWYGMVDVEAAFRVGGVQVTSLCDVDTGHLEKSAATVERLQGFRPKTFNGYQDLLKQEGLQAVIIATPPHWHALPFIAALEAGLNVYCEKPLAYDLREGEAMVAAAEKAGGVVQIGFQRRQSNAMRQAREYIQQGNAGDIIQVDAQIHYRPDLKDSTTQEPPASLDWDAWCGPAPKLPYSPNIGHFAWRLEKEYGNGHLVDWGIHLIDATRWILDESLPKSVQAAGGIYYFEDQITTPDILTAHFDFDTCPVVWRHRMFGAAEFAPETSNGIFFYGDKQTVFVADDRWVVVPKDRNQSKEVHEVRTDMGTAHMADFLTAVRKKGGGSALVSPADAHASTSTVQLAMLAYETGEKVSWNSETAEIEDNPKAAKLLKRPYREPWKHPFPS